MTDSLNQKYERLCGILGGEKRVLVAFSGGVDSSLLAKVAHMVLGDDALAVTVDSPTLPESELEGAKKIAGEIGIKHVIVRHNELYNENFVKNPPNRCYFCKKELAGTLKKIMKKFNANAILEGTNADEIRTHRPGMQAIREEGILTPLIEACLGKNDVRVLAERLGLSNHDKPSMACMSSRIPYHDSITLEKLDRIKKSEEYIRGLGVKQVRVRCYGGIACIEVLPHDFQVLLENKGIIKEKLSGFGFKHVGMDLGGYQSGSMNKCYNQSKSSSYSS